MSGASSSSRLAAFQAAHERHFVRRAKQRFGLRVSAARYREFCRRIIDVEDGVSFLSRESATRTQWTARFAGHLMRVVFDEESERLVTCMPYAVDRPPTAPRDRVMKRRRLARKERRKWN